MAGKSSWRPQYDSSRQKGGRGAYSPSKTSFSDHKGKGPSTFFAANWVVMGLVFSGALVLIALCGLLTGNYGGFLFTLVFAAVIYELFFHKRS